MTRLMVLAETCPTQWVLERCGLLIVSYAYKILKLVKESGQSERQEDRNIFKNVILACCQVP